MDNIKILQIGVIVFFVFFVPLSLIFYLSGWLPLKNSLGILLLWIPFMFQGFAMKLTWT